MAQTLFEVDQKFNLTDAGVKSEAISFKSTQLNPRSVTNIQEGEIVIIDIEDPSKVSKFPVKVDHAIANPIKEGVLALRIQESGTTMMQIFDIKERKKLKQYALNETVKLWKFINENTIGIITNLSIYLWDLNENAPSEIFNLHGTLSETEIVSFNYNFNLTWFSIISLSQKEGKLCATNQLYSLEKKQSQILGDCYVCNFLDDPTGSNTTIAFVKNSDLYVLDLNNVSQKIHNPFEFLDSNDFGISLYFTSVEDGYLFLITKMGFLFIFDSKNGEIISKTKISDSVIFSTIPLNSNNEFLSVNIEGNIFSIKANQNPKNITQNTNQNLENKTTLDDFESKFNELCSYFDFEKAADLALFSNRKNCIENWFKNDDFKWTETIGQITENYGQFDLSIRIFEKLNLHEKVIQNLVENNEISKIHTYIQNIEKTEYKSTIDFKNIFETLILKNCKKSVGFVIYVFSNNFENLNFNKTDVINTYLKHNKISEINNFIIDTNKDTIEDTEIQNLFFEINFGYNFNPIFLEMILKKKIFNFFDKIKIFQLFEEKGLYNVCLDYYEDSIDIKRVLKSMIFNFPESLEKFFETLPQKKILKYINLMIDINNLDINNIKLINNLILKYITLDFYEFKKTIFFSKNFSKKQKNFFYFNFIQSVLNDINDDDIFLKYIKIGFKEQFYSEITEFIQLNNEYDPDTLKTFFLEQNLNTESNIYPFFYLCNKYNYIYDLTKYLYDKNNLDLLQIFLSKINPKKTSMVVSNLLDFNTNEKFIKKLIFPENGRICKLGLVIEEFEKRNKQLLILKWIKEDEKEDENNLEYGEEYQNQQKYEMKFESNNQYKSKNDEKNSVEQFINQKDQKIILETNYQNENNNLILKNLIETKQHEKLITYTNKHSLFKDQVNYLFEQNNKDLWINVLKDKFKDKIITEILNEIIPYKNQIDNFNLLILSFLELNFEKELILILNSLLKKDEFSKNESLQNLLILKSVKFESLNIMELLENFNNYNSQQIGEILIDNNLFEEAFFCFKKVRLNEKALNILIENLKNFERAYEFIEFCNIPELYSKLGFFQLKKDLLASSIQCFIKSKDDTYLNEITELSSKLNDFTHLIPYLEEVLSKDKNVYNTFVQIFLRKNEEYNCNEEIIKDIQNIQDLFNSGFIGIEEFSLRINSLF